jgi:ArsR family transcriptional regulator
LPFALAFGKGDFSLPKKAGRDDLQAEVFERQARICKAFANSTRLRMLDLLGKRDWGAAELQQELGISKANLSQHIAVLKGAGIVDARRAGKAVYFSLTMPEVKSACHLIRDVLRAQIRDGRRLSV